MEKGKFSANIVRRANFRRLAAFKFKALANMGLGQHEGDDGSPATATVALFAVAAGISAALGVGVYFRLKWQAERKAKEEGGLIWRWRVPLLAVFFSVVIVTLFSRRNFISPRNILLDQAEAKAEKAEETLLTASDSVVDKIRHFFCALCKSKEVVADAAAGVGTNLTGAVSLRKFVAGFLFGVALVTLARNKMGAALGVDCADLPASSSSTLFYT